MTIRSSHATRDRNYVLYITALKRETLRKGHSGTSTRKYHRMIQCSSICRYLMNRNNNNRRGNSNKMEQRRRSFKRKLSISNRLSLRRRMINGLCRTLRTSWICRFKSKIIDQTQQLTQHHLGQCCQLKANLESANRRLFLASLRRRTNNTRLGTCCQSRPLQPDKSSYRA